MTSKSDDHVERAIDRLISRYRKPKHEALLRSYMGPVQQVEDATYEVLTKRTIEGGETDQLDTIGRIVDFGRGAFDRNSTNNDDYRAALAIRIRALRSGGRTKDWDELLTMLVALTGGTFGYEEIYPAKVRISLYEVTYDPGMVVSVLLFAKAMGVGLQIFITDRTRDKIFRFSPVVGAPAYNSGRGFDEGVFKTPYYP